MRDQHASRRGNDGYTKRSVGTRETVQRFLVVCEGEKTEPNYFRSFRVPKNVVTFETFVGSR